MRIDYDTLEKEVEKLKEKRSRLMRQGQMASAFAIDSELKEVEKKMKWMVTHEHERFSTLLSSLPLDQQRKWSRNCMLMILLADMLDSVTTDVNGQLLNITGMYISTMDTVKQMKRLSAKLVHIFDRDSESDEMRIEWGELSDHTLLYVQNMANAYMTRQEAREKATENK